MSAKARIAYNDPRDRFGDVFCEVLGRRRPAIAFAGCDLGTSYDRSSIRTANNVAAYFDGFPPFFYVTERNVRNAKNTAFFLDSSAVGKNQLGILFKLYKVEETERVKQPDRVFTCLN